VNAARLWVGVGVLVLASSVRADDWPQWLGPQRDGVWRETGILSKFPNGGPKVLWRTPVGGGYSGPAIANGKVYLTDRKLTPGSKDPDNPFTRSRSEGIERVVCLDAATGKQLWEHVANVKYDISYPCGPRATPVIADGKVWALGAMGDLWCLDANTGKLIWSRSFTSDKDDYQARVPLWGFSAHPLLDGDKLICLVGGEGSVVVAFDKDTGKEKWKALSFQRGDTQIGYCPPMIYKAGGARQLIIWHPEGVNSLDPESGKLHWSEKFLLKANLAIPTPRQAGDLLFVTSFYNGSMMLKLDQTKPAASVVWKSQDRGETPDQTKDLHSIIATPYLRDGYIYGVCSYGELRCLRAEDGKRIWQDLTATGKQTKPTERWANAFLTPQGERWFLFNEKGDLIIAKLSPEKYEEIDRAHLLEPTGRAGRPVLWSHPAYANKCIFARNDKEIICVSLAAE
jgi:outer membrane protein assembly factor BamB